MLAMALVVVSVALLFLTYRFGLRRGYAKARADVEHEALKECGMADWEKYRRKPSEW
jgi:hypothetical protein